MAHNTALKLAIFSRRKTQIEIAKRAGIHETRLSKIVRGHLDATPEEQSALARALRTTVAELFPSPTGAPSQA